MSETIIDRLDRENIELAPINKRVAAYVIDDIVISILFFAIYWNWLVDALNDPEKLANLLSSFTLELIALKIVYHTFFTWYYGATIGKITLKIVCLDTVMLSKPKFAASLLRACFRVCGEICFYLGFVWALGNQEKQTWHDKIANTVVCNAY